MHILQKLTKNLYICLRTINFSYVKGSYVVSKSPARLWDLLSLLFSGYMGEVAGA